METSTDEEGGKEILFLMIYKMKIYSDLKDYDGHLTMFFYESKMWLFLGTFPPWQDCGFFSHRTLFDLGFMPQLHNGKTIIYLIPKTFISMGFQSPMIS